MKEVTLYRIVKEEAMVGDYIDMIESYRHHDHNVMPLLGTSEGIEPFEVTIEKFTAPIKTVRFSDSRPDQYWAVDPQDKSEILTCIESMEIEKLNNRLTECRNELHDRFIKIKQYENAGHWTRVKWLFTGVKI